VTVASVDVRMVMAPVVSGSSCARRMTSVISATYVYEAPLLNCCRFNQQSRRILAQLDVSQVRFGSSVITALAGGVSPCLCPLPMFNRIY